MSYEVIVERKARRALARLPSTAYERTMRAVNALAEDPRPRQGRSLEGRSGRRLRVIYEVDDDLREVYVAEVWNRRRDYR